jgi:DNA-binding MarR family transcriptional regulator
MIYKTGCMCIKLRQASNNITKIYDKALNSHHIKLTQYSTLKNIEKLVTPSIQTLSNKMNLDRSTLVRNLNKLQKMKLISYEYENNSKSKVIRLTLDGNKKLSEAHVEWKKIQNSLLKNLGLEEIKQLDILLSKIDTIRL